MLDFALFLACLFAGLVNSVAGGGIIIVFPALLAAGLPPVVANTTSHLITWPGSLSSAYAYRKHLRKLPRKYLLLLIPCLIGAAIGAYLISNTENAEFTRAVPWLVLISVVLFLIQPSMHRHLERNLSKHRNAPLIGIGIALLPMSIYGGYFGAGFGLLMLAFLGFTRLNSLHQINGLKNLASAAVTILCTIYFMAEGLIDWRFAPAMMTGSFIGGYLGAHFAQKINKKVLHNLIVIIGLIVAVYLFVKS